MSNTGTILELEYNRVLVMTSECDFVFIKRKSGMFCGQQIEFVDRDIKTEKSIIKKAIPYTAGVAAIFILIFSYFLFFHSQDKYTLKDVYAYVDVDINPSVEFKIDDNNLVKDYYAIDEDAKELLKDTDLNNYDLDSAIKYLVDKSKNLGFLDEETDSILVSICLNDEYKTYSKEIEAQKNQLVGLENTINSTLKETIYNTMVLKSNPEILKSSRANKTSIARQIFYTEQVKNGINLSVEDAKSTSVSEIIDVLEGYDAFEGQETSKETISNVVSTPTEAVKTPKDTINSSVTSTAKSTDSESTSTPVPVTSADKATPTSKHTLKASSSEPNIRKATPTPKTTDAPIFAIKPTERPSIYPILIPIDTPQPSPTNTPTPSPTDIPTATPLPTDTPQPTATNTPKPTSTPVSVIIPPQVKIIPPTNTPTVAPTHTNTPAPTDTPKPTNTMVPTASPTAVSESPTLSSCAYSDYIELNWTEGEPDNFLYYKVVISKSNPHPIYPDDGYLHVITDPTETNAKIEKNSYYSGDINGELVSGSKYYVSITYVYSDKKYTSNTLYLSMP